MEKPMLLKKIAVIGLPLFLSAAALAETQRGVEGNQSPAQESQSEAESSQIDEALSKSFSVLHAAVEGAINVSNLAAENAKSELVKEYASTVASGNAALLEKIKAIAAENSVTIVALDPQTEAGKSLIDRLEAEKAMLASLKGDAFDKLYMTLVTNAQQSVLKFAEVRIATATNERVKEFFTNLRTLVSGRNTIAQGIMEKVYGDDL
jgi:predicted outer membrane protein